MPDEQPDRSHGVPFAEAIGKWLAVFGSLVAVGQAGSTWVTGYWEAEAARQKSQQELALAGLKDKSELAQQYLKVILDKDTKPADRATLLTALSEIEGHPLQHWAKIQFQQYQKELSQLFDAYKAQNEAAQLRDDSQGQLARMSADIERLSSEIDIEQNDPEKRAALQNQRLVKYVEVGRIKATLSVASVRLDDTRSIISRSQQGLAPGPSSAGGNVADAITAISNRIETGLLMQVFPESARKDVEANVPFLRAAFQEFKISDKKLAASIIGTVAVETPNFESYEEPVAQAARYENRADLGNTQPGDGVRYRGRGYLGITGRTNYARMSARLGLGTALLDSPEDAKSPEVATRILVAWFVDRQDVLSAALESGDLARIRVAVNGSPAHLDRFTAAYNKILAEL